MARIKGGLNAKKKHNRTLKLAKGYRGARSKQYRIAKQSVMRALASSYAGRKQKKRRSDSSDRTYHQRCCKNERTFLQQDDARLKKLQASTSTERCLLTCSKRCRRLQSTCRDC